MKAASGPMQAHIAQGQTTLAFCLEITRTDGTIMAFTEHDEDLVIGGVTFLASSGFSKFNLTDKSNLDVSNIQLEGMIDGTIITRADIEERRYDYARVQITLVNWADLSMGSIILLTGKTGTWTINEFAFKTELYGLAKELEQIGGEICLPTCRVDFGSSRCAPGGILADGTTIDSLMQSGTVLTTDGTRTMTVSGIADLGKPLNGGLLTWLTGNNQNLSIEVKLVDLGTSTSPAGPVTILLYLPMFLTIQAGDTFKLLPACQKRFYQDCVASYKNGLNFQAEPHVPGPDHQLDYPDYDPTTGAGTTAPHS